MSYYKGKRRAPETGRRPPDGPAARESVQRDFERCGTEVQESAESSSLRWEATFALEEGCFWVSGQPGKVEASPQLPAVLRTKVVAFPNYPVTDLQRAIQRAREAAGIP